MAAVAPEVRARLTSAFERPPRVLVVDDDLLTLRLLEIILTQAGCEVTALSDPLEVKRCFAAGTIGPFDCATIDYSMPGCNGLELMRALHEADSCLGSILLTLAEEQHLVRDSFREGAADFINKPIRNEELLTTIRQALERTRERRKRFETQRSLQDASRASHVFRNLGVPDIADRLATAYIPRDEVGGDFLDIFRRKRGDLVCVLGDVAGHDFRSALLSAFFSGFLEGLIHQDTDVHDILRAFNRRLHEASPDTGLLGSPDSIAAGVLVVDPAEKSVEIITCGFPSPLVTYGDGRIVEPDVANSPLGWFADYDVEGSVVPLADASCVFAFTDGLQDFAAERDISVGAVALQMLSHAEDSPVLAELVQDSSDDILFSRLQMRAAVQAGHCVHPLFFARYEGPQLADIDTFEEEWQASLSLAFPTFERLPDLLLCCREMVLNALKHGCQRAAGRFATLQITYCEVSRRLRVRVEDDGPGHAFDVEDRKAHLETCDESFSDPGRHLGLVLLDRTADGRFTERRGATVVFDFFLDRTPVSTPPA